MTSAGGTDRPDGAGEEAKEPLRELSDGKLDGQFHWGIIYIYIFTWLCNKLQPEPKMVTLKCQVNFLLNHGTWSRLPCLQVPKSGQMTCWVPPPICRFARTPPNNWGTQHRESTDVYAWSTDIDVMMLTLMFHMHSHAFTCHMPMFSGCHDDWSLSHDVQWWSAGPRKGIPPVKNDSWMDESMVQLVRWITYQRYTVNWKTMKNSYPLVMTNIAMENHHY